MDYFSHCDQILNFSLKNAQIPNTVISENSNELEKWGFKQFVLTLININRKRFQQLLCPRDYRF